MSRKLLVTALLVVSVSLLAVGQAAPAMGPATGATDVYTVNPEASLYGLSGLWKVISADSTPAKSFGTSGYYDRINRNPGQLTITSTGTSAFYSFTNRFELGVQINVNERVLSRQEQQLSLGQVTLNTLGYSGGCVGCPTPIGGAVAMPGFGINQLRNPLTNALTGRAGYDPLLPYVNRRLQTGTGEVIVGGKINLKSERRGDNSSWALHPWISVPTHYNTTDLFNTGGQYGKFYGGMDLLASKNLGMMGFNVNVGFEYLPAENHSGQIPLIGSTKALPASIGINIPRTRRLQFIAEINSMTYLNQAVPQSSFGPEDPIDAVAGFRGYIKSWLAISAGYRHTLNQFGGDKNGFTFQLATSNLPVAPAAPMPPPPAATCSADPTRVMAGMPVRLTAVGCATCQRKFEYKWSSEQGRIEGMGPEVRYDTTGLKPGEYSATVRVSDGPYNFSDCTAKFSVIEPPKPNPPTATCSVDRSSLRAGEAATFSASANSADNRPLTYAWTISGGARLTGANGRSARFDTTGLGPGTYTATLRVSDDRGLSTTCTSSATVASPPPAPEARLLNTCSFTSKAAKLKPARVDNACKAVLDDVALRMQSEADSSMVLVGNSDPAELKTKYLQKKNANLAAQRAANVKEYMVTEKGLAANRFEVRSATGGPAKVDMWLVPRGASYKGSGATVTEPKGQPRNPAKKKPAAKKPATPPADAPK